MMSFCLPLFLQSLPAIGQDDLTLEEVNGLFETLSNWGRWGTDDQMGTVNHITPEIRIAQRDSWRQEYQSRWLMKFSLKRRHNGKSL